MQRKGRGQCPWEACPSVLSSTSALCLPFLPQEALCSLAVPPHTFDPPTQGTLVSPKESPDPGIGLEEWMT